MKQEKTDQLLSCRYFRHRCNLNDTLVPRGIANLSAMLLVVAALSSASCKQRSLNNAAAKSNRDTSPSADIQSRSEEFESLLNLSWNRIRTLSGGISFKNPPLPSGAKTPDAGAKHTYDRGASLNARVSTMDIEIFAYDDLGAPIHAKYEASLKQLYTEIWGWKRSEWEDALAPLQEQERSRILTKKSNLFWEYLAQQLAERVFAQHKTPDTSLVSQSSPASQKRESPK